MNSDVIRSTVAVEMWPIGRLKPRATNSRTHSEEQVNQIVAAIKEFGWTNPIIAGDQDDIIAGHARLMAAEKLQLEEVPVIALGYLTEDQKRALVIADNQLALNAGWNDEILAAELSLLQAAEFNLDLLGFSEAALADLIAGPGGAAGSDPVAAAKTLAERFGVPPFSVLDARQGYWQERKRAWLALGIKSEEGRGAPAYNDHQWQADTLGHVQAPTKVTSTEGTKKARHSKANAIPSGHRMPAVSRKTGKIVRSDSRARPIEQRS